MAQAIREKAEREGLREVLAEVLRETGGPPTAAERARSRRELANAVRDARQRASR